MTRLTRFARALGALAVAGALALGSPACGGDDPPPKPSRSSGDGEEGAKKATAKKASKKSGKGKGKGKGGTIDVYPKVPDEYRHEFEDKDFLVDVTGDENRDPFRSYVLSSRAPVGGTITTVEDTEVCNRDNSVATTFQLRNLMLLGIVLRGTNSYALFRDSGGYGHIVRRGDCLGKEKARVEAIGAGFVRLTVIPEAPPGAPAPAPQTRDIALHPEEFSLEPQE